MILYVDTDLNIGRLSSKKQPTPADFAILEKSIKNLVGKALDQITTTTSDLDLELKPLPYNS